MSSYFSICKKKLRLFRMGLSTILGLSPQGFFIPYRYTKELSLYKKQIVYSQLEILFAEKEDALIERIEVLKEFTEDLRKIGKDNPPQPRWDQDWFPPLDAAIAYSIVRTYKPELIIEVGSGHSTRFMSFLVTCKTSTHRFATDINFLTNLKVFYSYLFSDFIR